jgi:hypothetical protein
LAESIFLRRARVVILMCDRMLGHGFVRDCLRTLPRFTAAPTAATTPAAASGTSFALAVRARLFFVRFFGGSIRRFGYFLAFHRFGVIRNDVVFFFIHRREW